MTTTVVIPTRNENGVVIEVAHAASAYCDHVVIVDGHSSDGSPERLRAEGFHVIQDRGRGKGDAIRLGLEAATDEIVVTMDADGSHDPAEIPRLLAPIVSGEADMVIGCRMRGGSDEFAGTWTMFVRLWGNNFLTQIINTRFRTSLSDSQNGFRAIRGSRIAQLKLTENLHTIELEMVLKGLKQGLRITQVPSHEHARRVGRSSLSVVRQTPAFLWCLLRNVW